MENNDLRVEKPDEPLNYDLSNASFNPAAVTRENVRALYAAFFLFVCSPVLSIPLSICLGGSRKLRAISPFFCFCALGDGYTLLCRSLIQHIDRGCAWRFLAAQRTHSWCALHAYFFISSFFSVYAFFFLIMSLTPSLSLSFVIFACF